MTTIDDDLARAYTDFDESADLLPAVERILESHDVSGARAAFERGGARDFLGLEDEAIPLYREALELGLSDPDRLPCLIQLSSSLRNVGETGAAVQVLRVADEEAQRHDQGATRDWVAAFLALALHADGQPAQALAPHLTRYERAVAAYADHLA